MSIHGSPEYSTDWMVCDHCRAALGPAPLVDLLSRGLAAGWVCIGSQHRCPDCRYDPPR